jgi:hypothetical protein
MPRPRPAQAGRPAHRRARRCRAEPPVRCAPGIGVRVEDLVDRDDGRDRLAIRSELEGRQPHAVAGGQPDHAAGVGVSAPGLQLIGAVGGCFEQDGLGGGEDLLRFWPQGRVQLGENPAKLVQRGGELRGEAPTAGVDGQRRADRVAGR